MDRARVEISKKDTKPVSFKDMELLVPYVGYRHFHIRLDENTWIEICNDGQIHVKDKKVYQDWKNRESIEFREAPPVTITFGR